MNISSVLNPSAVIGQLSVWVVAILIGFIAGGYSHYKFMTEDCPPVTQIHVDPKIKGVKKGSNVNLDIRSMIGLSNDSCNYELFLDNYIQETTVKEFRQAKRD